MDIALVQDLSDLTPRLQDGHTNEAGLREATELLTKIDARLKEKRECDHPAFPVFFDPALLLRHCIALLLQIPRTHPPACFAVCHHTGVRLRSSCCPFVADRIAVIHCLAVTRFCSQTSVSSLQRQSSLSSQLRISDL